jgi:membrane fusion protein (multidrug efflux system)
MMRPYSRPAQLILLVLLLPGCREGEAEATSETDEPERVASVEVVEVARHPFQRTLKVSANVVPQRTVGVVGKVPGTIEAMLVDEGDRVDEGQVLVRLDQRDYLLGLRQAQAQVVAAKASTALAAIGVESAETQKQRMESLRESNAIAESELEKVTDGYRMGVAKQSAAQAQLQLAKVGVSAAKTKLSDTVIRAPFAGVVLERSMDQGAHYHPSSRRPLLLLAEDHLMRIEGSVGERDLEHIRAGMTASVHVDALSGSPISGVVEIVSPVVDPRTRTAKVRVTLENPEGRLGTGMSARIVLDLGAEEVLALPDDALRRLGSGSRAEVFVVEGGRALRREVEVGARLGDRVEIVRGLVEGQVVARSGHATLEDGDAVTIFREPGASE